MPQIATRPDAGKRLSDVRASDRLCLDLVSSILYTMLRNPVTDSFETESPAVDRPAAARVGVCRASLRDKVTDEIRNAILPRRYRQGERLIEDNPIREALRTLASEARPGAVALVTGSRGPWYYPNGSEQ